MDGENRIVKLVEAKAAGGQIVDPKAPLATARQLLAELHGGGDQPTLRRWRGDFLSWIDGAYRRQEEAAIREAIYTFLDNARCEDGSAVTPTARRVSDVADALRAAAPAPAAWHRFLGEVWPDDAEARDTLQEWFGCSLMADMPQHKIALIVGPKRSGSRNRPAKTGRPAEEKEPAA